MTDQYAAKSHHSNSNKESENSESLKMHIMHHKSKGNSSHNILGPITFEEEHAQPSMPPKDVLVSERATELRWPKQKTLSEVSKTNLKPDRSTDLLVKQTAPFSLRTTKNPQMMSTNILKKPEGEEKGIREFINSLNLGKNGCHISTLERLKDKKPQDKIHKPVHTSSPEVTHTLEKMHSTNKYKTSSLIGSLDVKPAVSAILSKVKNSARPHIHSINLLGPEVKLSTSKPDNIIHLTDSLSSTRGQIKREGRSSSNKSLNTLENIHSQLSRKLSNNSFARIAEKKEPTNNSNSQIRMNKESSPKADSNRSLKVASLLSKYPANEKINLYSNEGKNSRVKHIGSLNSHKPYYERLSSEGKKILNLNRSQQSSQQGIDTSDTSLSNVNGSLNIYSQTASKKSPA